MLKLKIFHLKSLKKKYCNLLKNITVLLPLAIKFQLELQRNRSSKEEINIMR